MFSGHVPEERRLIYRHHDMDKRGLFLETVEEKWNLRWANEHVLNIHLVDDSTLRSPGFDLPRAEWTILNGVRTEQSRCNNNLMHKWWVMDSRFCTCDQTPTHRRKVSIDQLWKRHWWTQMKPRKMMQEIGQRI